MGRRIIRWIIIALVAMGYMNVIYANGIQSRYSGFRNTEAFWQVYTDALRGDKIAQFQTGVIYERGIGVEQNQTKAALWYEKSAEQGYMDAQYNLALMNASGRGVDKNLERAVMWLTKAAQQGDQDARTLLSEIMNGKLDKDKSSGGNKPLYVNEIEEIEPVRLKTKEGGRVCTLAGECLAYKENTVITSHTKRGLWYKISGIVSVKGWKSYDKEGWIEEKDVQRD